MNTEIEAILIDVDGCIVVTNGDIIFEYHKGLKRISEYVEAANRRKFPPIGFCSGRDRNYIEAVSFFVGVPNSWSVIESGIALFNPKTKALRFNPILTEEAKRVFEEIATKRMPKFLERNPMLFLYPGNMVCVAIERKYGVALTIEDIYEAVKRELADLLQSHLVQITHSDCAIDISPAGIDKASGLQFLSREMRINLKKTLGIGDSKGDFPLFGQVGFVGCPANASDECRALVKERKGHISPFYYSEGVAEIIDHFTA